MRVNRERAWCSVSSSKMKMNASTHALRISGLLIFTVFMFACIGNSEKSGSKSEYRYNRLEGVVFKYFGGKKDSSSINGIREYGLRFDSSAAMFFPQVMNKILKENRRYSLKFEESKITPGMIVPCDEMENHFVKCNLPEVLGSSALMLSYSPDEFRIGHYAFNAYSKGGSFRLVLTGKNKNPGHMDSIIESGRYDSILYFQGGHIYD